MKRISKLALTFLVLNFSFFIHTTAQVAINENNSNPHASAMLDISSTDKGLLIPRLTSEERDAIQNPAQGLMIFNTSDSCFNYYTGMEWYKDCGRDLETDEVALSPITLDNVEDDNAQDVAFDDSGNAYITGTFENSLRLGDTTLTTGVSAAELYLAKFDSNNALVWATRIGGDRTESDPSITVDNQGNIILAATFSSTFSLGNTTLIPIDVRDILVAKFNSDGVLQWVQQLEFSNRGNEPSVEVDANDNIYVAGSFRGSVTLGNSTLSSSLGDNAGFIAKFNSSGTSQWALQINSDDDDLSIKDVAVQGNQVYVAGSISGSSATIGTDSYTIQGDLDGFFAEYDLDGNYIASSVITSSYYSECYAIAVDDSGNIFVGGYAFENIDIDGTSFQILNGESLFLTKFDSDQHLTWVRYQDNDKSKISDLALDENGNIIATGDFQGTLTFPTTSISETGSGEEVFIFKYDTDGNFVWVEQGVSSSDSEGEGIGLNDDNVIYLVGVFRDDVTFSEVSIDGVGDSDALIVLINNDGGSQSYFDNSLANTQDGDTDASNELQNLSFDGNTLSISLSNSVDLSSLMTNNTDKQSIDTFRLFGTTLALSLENDGVVKQTVDLSSLVTIDTDNQTVDKLNLNGTTLELSLEDDGESDQTVNLAALQDDLGDHIATQNIQLSDNWLSNDGGNEGIRIDNDGKVGIGETAPEEALEVNGNIMLGDNAKLYFSKRNNGANDGAYIDNPSDERLDFYADNTISFFESDDTTEVVTIDLNNSRVGIGETTPDVRFHVTGGGGEVLKVETTSNDRYFTVRPEGGSIDMFNSFFQINRFSTEDVIIVRGGGNVGIGEFTDQAPAYKLTINGEPAANGFTQFTNYSDRRLKHNIQGIGSALDRITQLRPVSFQYTAKTGYDSTALATTFRGFIAQELQAVFPEMVGEIQLNNETYLDANLSSLPIYLVKAVQEQQEQIQSLKAENKALKAQVAKINQLEVILQQLQAQVNGDTELTSVNSSTEK